MIKIVYCYRQSRGSVATSWILASQIFARIHTSEPARYWGCGEKARSRGWKSREGGGRGLVKKRESCSRLSITRCRSVFKIEFYLLDITRPPFYSVFRIFLVSRSLIHIFRRSRETFPVAAAAGNTLFRPVKALLLHIHTHTHV